ncbi:TPA: DUF3313 domain-containing protein [Serratia marcescens]|nr:DUF3313 domain-containing protein [Serratia marcescens]
MRDRITLNKGSLLLCIASLLSGCATNGMTRSGFLGDYDALSSTRYDNVLLYRATGFEPERYAEIVVDNAMIKTASGGIDGLDKTQQKEVLGYINSELQRQESKAVVTPGATGRVRVRVAITELETPNRVVNAFTTLLIGPVTTGGASLEFEAIDESTGRRVAAASCFERGNVFTEFVGSYKLLSHAKSAITTCIEQIDSAWRDTHS